MEYNNDYYYEGNDNYNDDQSYNKENETWQYGLFGCCGSIVDSLDIQFIIIIIAILN
jgi:hypothetical protein